MKRRQISVFFALLWVWIVLGGRLTYIALGEGYVSAAERQSRYTLVVDAPRGTIYDRNGKSLTNRQTVRKAALTATPQVISQIHKVFAGTDRDGILQQLSRRLPLVVETPEPIWAQGARTFVCKNPAPFHQPAVHLTGYLDAAGETGVCGLQKAYDALLRCGAKTTVTYACDAAGGALPGVEPMVSQQTEEIRKGLVTTLDLTCQLAAEQALAGVARGAVVIQKAGSGEVLASASVPDYSPARLAAALEDPALPFLNRALSAYNAGSVFKLCVAAAALEQGISPDRTYTCTGSIHCGETFHCHREEGHGELTMTRALAESCNPYFIDLAQAVGGRAIYDMAVELGFGAAAELCDGAVADAGSLPHLAELIRSPAELGNFAIGQGALMATPLQINALTGCIAGGGVAFSPCLVAGRMDRQGRVTPEKSETGRRVMSGDTAYRLQRMMETVLQEGTGTSGATYAVSGGGKTATAQTGILAADGSPVTQAWFTGFFPADRPAYVVTVLVEGGSSGGADAAPVFRAICRALAE